jgi:hypothetical protein
MAFAKHKCQLYVQHNFLLHFIYLNCSFRSDSRQFTLARNEGVFLQKMIRLGGPEGDSEEERRQANLAVVGNFFTLLPPSSPSAWLPISWCRSYETPFRPKSLILVGAAVAQRKSDGMRK